MASGGASKAGIKNEGSKLGIDSESEVGELKTPPTKQKASAGPEQTSAPPQPIDVAREARWICFRSAPAADPNAGLGSDKAARVSIAEAIKKHRRVVAECGPQHARQQLTEEMDIGEITFGTVPGVEVFDTFQDWDDLYVSRIHLSTSTDVSFYIEIRHFEDSVIAASLLVRRSSSAWRDRGDEIVHVQLIYADSVSSSKVPQVQQGDQPLYDDRHLQLGHEALKNNGEKGLPVRVIQEVPRGGGGGGGGYYFRYDGLYDLMAYSEFPTPRGFTIYEHKLNRRPGQPPLV